MDNNVLFVKNIFIKKYSFIKEIFAFYLN